MYMIYCIGNPQESTSNSGTETFFVRIQTSFPKFCSLPFLSSCWFISSHPIYHSLHSCKIALVGSPGFLCCPLFPQLITGLLRSMPWSTLFLYAYNISLRCLFYLEELDSRFNQKLIIFYQTTMCKNPKTVFLTVTTMKTSNVTEHFHIKKK